MSYLDSLENSLKALESREERDTNTGARRASERERALAAAPWAEELKKSPYTDKLLEESVAAGHRIRAKIYLAWVGTHLRLEVRGRALELIPTPDGVVAQFVTSAGESVEQSVDLKSDPKALLERWLAGESATSRTAAPLQTE